MALLLQYRLATGQISGLWESNTPELLDAQVVAEDPTYGYLMLEEAINGATLLEEYYMLEGVLTLRQVLTLTAEPTPFAADEVTVCTITVTPFVPCTLRVNGIDMAVTEEDPTLLLTADVPTVFAISLVPMVAYRAAAIIAEAV